jgi:hypothetical protein
MVETVYICPRLHAVARFAAKRCAIRAAPRHAVIEFTVMGINVARRTTLVLKVEGENFVLTSAGPNLVALIARHCHVRTRECEMGFAMIGDGKGGTVEILNRVAGLAPVLIWG